MIRLFRNPLVRFFILYYIVAFTLIAISYDLHIKLWEASYNWITCGEALHRHTGSAAPRDKIEEAMYNECLFRGIKKWKN